MIAQGVRKKGNILQKIFEEFVNAEIMA